MSENERSKRRRFPKVSRERAVPPDPTSRAECVRALTRKITALHAHVRAEKGWRDRRQLRALEGAINARGEVLKLLRSQAPTVWQTLCAELDLAYENPT